MKKFNDEEIELLYNLDLFSVNFARFRNEHKLSQVVIANKLEITKQAVSKWERGKSFPDLHRYLSLCNLFECSVDAMFEENTKLNLRYYNPYYYDKKKIADMLRFLRERNRFSQADIAKLVYLTPPIVAIWETGEDALPTIDNIKKICDTFNITMDDFFHYRKPETYRYVNIDKKIIKALFWVFGITFLLILILVVTLNFISKLNGNL